jgi:hypothetical protein
MSTFISFLLLFHGVLQGRCQWFATKILQINSVFTVQLLQFQTDLSGIGREEGLPSHDSELSESGFASVGSDRFHSSEIDKYFVFLSEVQMNQRGATLAEGDFLQVYFLSIR